ncbi:hypothetical protein BH20ACT2_BH20ACT2_22660 [soil metagenome]
MILVLFALTLVGLLVMAAAVVDVGAVYNHRRQDQSAVDSAALGAAQELPVMGESANEAIALVDASLDEPLATGAWNTCGSDAGALAVRHTAADCISFDVSRSRIRVRLPDQLYQTAFGRIVGIDEVRHAAFAVAAIRRQGCGGVLPFGLPNAAAASPDGYACLKANSGGRSQPPCDGPDQGNFGPLDLGFFGNASLGTTKSCGSGGTKDRMINNIAVGADHDLEPFASGTAKVDTVACNISSADPPPNAAGTQTGLSAEDTGQGLLGPDEFSDGGPARLRRQETRLFDGNGATTSVGGGADEVDDNPLWNFIPPDLASGPGDGGDIPVSCQLNQFVDSSGGIPSSNPNLPDEVRLHLAPFSQQDRLVKLLQRCFTHYRGQSWEDLASNGQPALTPADPRVGCNSTAATACTDPVFGVNSDRAESPDLWDIQYTPRFGYVPQLSGPFPNGSATVTFAAFRPVFIQRVIFKSNVVFDPGVGLRPVSAGADDLREVTAFVFPEDMLPNGLADADAAHAIGKNRFVQLVR